MPLSNNIVQVNVSLQQAPTPSLLQNTGAFVSQGATTKAQNSLTLLTQLSDLTAILAAAKPLLSLAWSGGVVTVTTTSPHGFTNADVVSLTIAGVSPTGYNGTYQCTITGTSTFTYSLASNPGSTTVVGTYTPEDVTELLAMATTFFAQGTALSVYVLELGQGTPNEGIATLTTWLANNPTTIYGILVPRLWDANANFLTLIQSFEASTALFYFWVTTTTGTYTNYTTLMKDVFAMVEAPSIPATEFSLAAAFYHGLAYMPSAAARVAPMCFANVFGVTPYPIIGNGSLLATLKAANVNYIQTGALGGITGTILEWGTTMDGRDYTYWYSVDWTQINLALDLTNEVINGANNAVNPLYYDQDGINRVQNRAASTMKRGITFGLAVGTVIQTEYNSADFITALDTNQFVAQAVVNAVPFTDYASLIPGDYKIGRYGGLSVVYIPQRGFHTIVVSLVVSDFVVGG